MNLVFSFYQRTKCVQFLITNSLISAQAAGLLCEEKSNYNDNVKYCGYCSHHYQKLVSLIVHQSSIFFIQRIKINLIEERRLKYQANTCVQTSSIS